MPKGKTKAKPLPREFRKAAPKVNYPLMVPDNYHAAAGGGLAKGWVRLDLRRFENALHMASGNPENAQRLERTWREERDRAFPILADIAPVAKRRWYIGWPISIRSKRALQMLVDAGKGQKLTKREVRKWLHQAVKEDQRASDEEAVRQRRRRAG